MMLSDSLSFLEFESGCRSLHGPHHINCLKTMWKKAGCLDEGYLHPSNLTEIDLSVLNEKSLL